jgi:AcrR family transcriptional regulator
LGLREEKKDWTRHQLLDAALELIARQGFEQTTVNEIAAAVRVSARTLLRYFPTKEDVIVAWVAEVMAVLPKSLAARPAGESPDEALKAAAREMLESYEARAKFFLSIERVIADSPTVSARKQQMMEDLVCEVGVALSARCDRKEKAAVLPDLYAGVIVAMVRAAIRAWLATNGRRSILESFDEAASAVRFVDTVTSLPKLK